MLDLFWFNARTSTFMVELWINISGAIEILSYIILFSVIAKTYNSNLTDEVRFRTKYIFYEAGAWKYQKYLVQVSAVISKLDLTWFRSLNWLFTSSQTNEKWKYSWLEHAWTSDSDQGNKEHNKEIQYIKWFLSLRKFFKEKATLVSWRLQSPKKRLTYEKCFVHPELDSKVKPNFEVPIMFTRLYNVRNVMNMK